MKATFWLGIIINGILIIGIIILISYGISLNSQLNQCQNQESEYCYTLTCPCDSNTSRCKGYATRDGNGGYYCSDDPYTLVKSRQR